jgi:hypothetical protein
VFQKIKNAECFFAAVRVPKESSTPLLVLCAGIAAGQ